VTDFAISSATLPSRLRPYRNSMALNIKDDFSTAQCTLHRHKTQTEPPFRHILNT